MRGDTYLHRIRAELEKRETESPMQKIMAMVIEIIANTKWKQSSKARPGVAGSTKKEVMK